MARLISLLTDFGLRDPYVGLMKAVLARTAPGATLVDLSHDIPRHAIETASFWLDRCFSIFPQGTIHLIVVDPTVGSERRPIAVSLFGQIFVCPDNGVLSDVLLRAREAVMQTAVHAVQLDRAQLGAEFTRTGTTFDGRDLFSPAAGKLAAGAALTDLGTAFPSRELVTLEVERRPTAARVRAIDLYGNVITDAPVAESGEQELWAMGRPIPFKNTYAEGALDELIAVRGSFGTIELSVNRGSAATLLDCQIGDLFPLK